MASKGSAASTLDKNIFHSYLFSYEWIDKCILTFSTSSVVIHLKVTLLPVDVYHAMLILQMVWLLRLDGN